VSLAPQLYRRILVRDFASGILVMFSRDEHVPRTLLSAQHNTIPTALEMWSCIWSGTIMRHICDDHMLWSAHASSCQALLQPAGWPIQLLLQLAPDELPRSWKKKVMGRGTRNNFRNGASPLDQFRQFPFPTTYAVIKNIEGWKGHFGRLIPFLPRNQEVPSSNPELRWSSDCDFVAL